MSILDRMTSHWVSTRHLTDDVLAEIWTSAVADGRTASHPHLSACSECRYRYADFTRFLDEIKDDAYAEVDQVMSAERLAAQQTQILRRLEALERPARVIAFPKATRPAISPSGWLEAGPRPRISCYRASAASGSRPRWRSCRNGNDRCSC